MPKLPILKSKEVVKVLEKIGFSFIRQKGSHRIYVKNRVGITIPWHNKDLKKGTLRHIVKQANLTPKEFIELLKRK